MNSREFLSILSRFYNGIKLADLDRWDHMFDIYDFKKRPQDYFREKVLEQLYDDDGWFDKVLREYALIQEKNVSLLYPGHDAYPEEFLYLENPPLYLTAQGHLSALTMPRISVVGSRHPSARVLDWMDMHLTSVVKENCVLISGAARGVDQRAHAICLRQYRPTIAFLPSGILQTYPSEFASWIPKIVACGGVVISEYAMNQKIHAHHFHERNRMIAKLGYLLFVCEARRRSGSIMTARLANENSKTVCVLPGFPSETANQGCVDLLFQGAFPIRDYADLKGLYAMELIKKLSIPNHTQRIDC